MTIRIDADTLRSNAKLLQGYKSTHDDNITAVKNLIQNMCNTDVFDGAAATEYLNQLNSYQATMSNFSEMLQDFSDSLTRIAEDFTQMDTGLAGALKK